MGKPEPVVQPATEASIDPKWPVFLWGSAREQLAKEIETPGSGPDRDGGLHGSGFGNRCECIWSQLRFRSGMVCDIRHGGYNNSAGDERPAWLSESGRTRRGTPHDVSEPAFQDLRC